MNCAAFLGVQNATFLTGKCAGGGGGGAGLRAENSALVVESALLRVAGAASVSPVFFQLVISRNVAQPQPLTERAGECVLCVWFARDVWKERERGLICVG